MLKRIFSLCLAVVLSLSMLFVLPVLAASSAQVQLVYDLGIVEEPDDYGLIPKTYDRSGFAHTLTMMSKTKCLEEVTVENAAKYASDNIAVNVYAADIMHVLNLGYMQTDEAGKFNTTKPITKNDAVCAIVKLLGYEPLVDANGGSLSGYLSVASKIGLLKGVSIADETKLTAEEVSRIVANAMGVPFIAYEGISGGHTCLWELWDVAEGTGVVLANSNMGMAVSKVAPGYVRIGKNTLYSRIDIPNELIGAKVTYYTVPGDRGAEVVSIFEETKSENLTLTPADIDSVTDKGSYLELIDAEENEIQIDKLGHLLINGKVYTPTKALFNLFDSGSATFLDTDRDGYYDVIHMTLLYQAVIEGVNAETMTLRTLLDNQTIDLSGADVVEIYVGKKTAAFSEVKAGMVVGVACDAFTISGSEITYNFMAADYIRLYASSRSEIGMIDGIDETRNTFSINGTPRSYGSGYNRLTAPRIEEVETNGTITEVELPPYISKLKLGYYVEAFYDNQGKLTYYKVVEGSEGLNYGYLIAGGVEGGALESTTKLKILDANSKFTEYATSKKFILDGAVVDTGSTTYSVNAPGDVNLASRQVIRFRVLDGIVREIDTKVIRAMVEDTANTLDEVLASGTKTIRSGAIDRSYVFASKSVMFVDEAPSDAVNPSEKMFSVQNAANLGDDDYTLACYDANDDMEIACIVRRVGSSSGSSSQGRGPNSYCHLVEEISRSVDEEGNPVWILSLAGDGTKGNYLVPSDTLKLYCIPDLTQPMEGSASGTNEYPPIELKDANTFESVIKPGDVVRINTNTAGNITYIEKIFDFETHKNGYIPSQTKTGQYSAFVRVEKVKDKNLIYDNGDDGSRYISQRTTHYAQTVLYHVKSGKAEIMSFANLPSAATGNIVKAFIRFYNKGQNRDNIFYIYD